VYKRQIDDCLAGARGEDFEDLGEEDGGVERGPQEAIPSAIEKEEPQCGQLTIASRSRMRVHRDGR
jgi:hypothetical protein